MGAVDLSALERRNGPRWAFFMAEASISLELSRTAPTRSLRRAWLDQADSEIVRAGEAAREYRKAIAA